MIFFARAEKGIARHIDASSVVWTLIDNGKLANQIARLAAIMVKHCFVPSIDTAQPFKMSKFEVRLLFRNHLF